MHTWPNHPQQKAEFGFFPLWGHCRLLGSELQLSISCMFRLKLYLDVRTGCLQRKSSHLQSGYNAVSVLSRLCYDYSMNLHLTTAGNVSPLSGIEERLNTRLDFSALAALSLWLRFVG